MVNVINTITGEEDFLPNHLAIRLMERTNGLWKEKTEEEVKPAIKRRRRRTREQIQAGITLDDLLRVS